MSAKLFNSNELIRLYKQGLLKPVMNQFKDVMNTKNLAGAGTDATVFFYSEKTQVLKLCPKNINYFAQFGCSQAEQFRKHINMLAPIFLPVDDILYEDDNVFVYTQKACKILSRKSITEEIVFEIFKMVQFMIINNIILTDLAPHNIGIYDQQVVFFDYHGLCPLKLSNGQIKHKKWWVRLFRNLTSYLCSIYSPSKDSEYSRLIDNVDLIVIEKMKKHGRLPPIYIELLNYVMNYQNEVSLETIALLLQNVFPED